jgi:hypothetical protein
LESTLRASLQYVDEYSWIYTEHPKWWTPDGGGPTGLTQPYLDAVYNVVPEPATPLLMFGIFATAFLRRRGR